jgi:uncharacterized membrane protein YkvA (DUF1232 family)
MPIDTWKQESGQLKGEVVGVYVAMEDPKTPWWARVLAGIIVGYAFSPIDLIRDPIPILGYLDDLFLLPLDIVLLTKIIPPETLVECRAKAAPAGGSKRPKNWTPGSIIIAI